MIILQIKQGVCDIKKTLKIGTRGSALALAQARLVAEKINVRHPDIVIETIVIKTKGDILQDVPLAKIGGKGLFVKEIEDALLKEEIDIAVHSMKDVPADIPEGLEIAIISEREDPRDVLISKENMKLEDMPEGARIGTGSLRRGFQIRNMFSSINIVPIRGNLDTRIRKIETNNLHGIIVAAAGLRRMGWTELISQVIGIDTMLPSVGQGALGIELRKGDAETNKAVSFINHHQTWLEITAERAFLKRLGGGCQLPIAAYAKKEGDYLTLIGLLGSIDGSIMLRDDIKGHYQDSERIGVLLAEKILSLGGEAILRDLHHNCIDNPY